MVVGYVRVSTEKQDLSNQKLAILEFANKQNFKIDEIVEIVVSGNNKRRSLEFINKLVAGDIIIATELSRLGRSMFEVVNLIHTLNERGIKCIFVNQPELSTGLGSSATQNLLFCIYAFFAQTEREFISERTKQGLLRAKANGKKLGRPKGRLGKSPFDNLQIEIETMVAKGISLISIWKINPCNRTYQNFVQFCKSRGINKNKLSVKEFENIMKEK